MGTIHLCIAARVLRRGGIVAYPTEGVWGLGCDPLNPYAVHRLFALKQRPMHKGLILIAHEFSALAPFLQPLTPALEKRVLPTWPGPVTWLLPCTEEAPYWLRGTHDTLAVRVTAHPAAAELCRAFGGAIVSTSANPAGRQPARSALQVRRYFNKSAIALLPGATGTQQGPTEIREGLTGVSRR